ncbi:PIH1 domain-containing protein 2 isoform X2 [Pezoporus wallicus]|uniref:PIH1 domain-containing protein 2 isoform X2 n=1 Tax=Pezoporus wallicus TaxID=35540 RepID=UPI0025507BBB|nr:PIH1 domain-containing protein 2 isoform X2 [Pezoporus wallicus]
MAGAALTRAAQLWSLLDEMAENEPQAYRRLLQQQRAEAELFCAPPEPHLCLRARPAVGARGRGRGLPPGCCGTRALSRGSVSCRVVSGGRCSSMSAAGKGSRHLKVPLTPHLSVRGRYKRYLAKEGSLETMQQRLRGRQRPTPHHSQNTKKELTLDEMLHTMKAGDCSNASVLLKEEHVRQPKGHLIEEIASTETPEKLSTPAYEMITVKDANKKSLKIELRIELPKVSSVSECDLRMSKDDIVIEVPGKYKLQLELPELVDEETTTAVFNKGKQILFITVLVAKPDP